MNLPQQFEQSLSAVQTGPTQIALNEAPRHLLCDIDQVTSLAVRIYELRIKSDELANIEVDELLTLSQDLSAKVNYLLEPIGPVEVDSDSCTVQLRSNPPHKDDDGHNYYELLVSRGGQIQLIRYRKEPTQRRQSIGADLTHEVLNRLVTDFCDILDQVTP